MNSPPAAAFWEIRRTQSHAAVQTQPIFDQFNDDLVRHQIAALSNFGRLQSKRRSEIFFPTQDRAWRSDRNAELAGDHFRLRPFPGTGRAEKNKSPFHLASVKKDRDSADDEHCDADIEPHERAAAAAASPRRRKRDQMLARECGLCAKIRRNGAGSNAFPPAAWYRALRLR